jgi:hypothetical protein
MNKCLEKSSEIANRVLAELPERMQNVADLLQKEFPKMTPSQVNSSFTPGVTAHAATNPQMVRLVNIVVDEIHTAIQELQSLERWIQLLIPQVADGNNFGVEVQKCVQIQISASKTALQKAWDGMTDYYWQRATAYEKFATKVSLEKSKSSSTSTEEGGKDAGTKKSMSTSEKESTSESAPIPDLIAYIVAVDVKWYFNLQRTLESVGDHYAYTLDIVEKNSAKIKLPRGHGERGMSMF